jgi:hypothetical protein
VTLQHLTNDIFSGKARELLEAKTDPFSELKMVVCVAAGEQI